MSDDPRKTQSTESGEFLRRVLIVAIITLVFVGISLVVVFAIDILLLLFAGLLFGRFLVGLSRLLTARTRFSYHWSLAIVSIELLLIFGGAVAFLVPRISHEVIELSDQLADATQHLYQQVKDTDLFARLSDHASESGGWLPDFNTISAIGGIFSTTTGALTGLGLILFVGIYMAADPELYTKGILSLVPPDRRSRASQVLHEVGDTTWWWIVGRLASMAIIGVLVTLGLWMMGIPVPLSLGILAALLTFIPNLGPLIALVPPTLLALQDGPLWAVGVVAFYLVVQIVESYVITPIIQQRSVNLPPLLTLSSQILLGFFTGIIGLAVASPLAAVGRVLVRELYIKDVLEKGRPGDVRSP